MFTSDTTEQWLDFREICFVFRFSGHGGLGTENRSTRGPQPLRLLKPFERKPDRDSRGPAAASGSMEPVERAGALERKSGNCIISGGNEPRFPAADSRPRSAEFLCSQASSPSQAPAPLSCSARRPVLAASGAASDHHAATLFCVNFTSVNFCSVGRPTRQLARLEGWRLAAQPMIMAPVSEAASTLGFLAWRRVGSGVLVSGRFLKKSFAGPGEKS